MKDITVQISDDPVYCKGCKAISYDGFKCLLSEILVDVIKEGDNPWVRSTWLHKDDDGKITKCRWCIETYPCEEK